MTGSIINLMVPYFPFIEERMLRAKELERNLLNCPAGKKAWRKYEKICIDILKFAFIPPARKIFIQVRSANGEERRDAMMPNHGKSPFWSKIRTEFNCRHLVCEFKNSQKEEDKDAINQLRIYLSKPTIGRFGILFTRKPPSKSMLMAQRSAYEQSNILILIFHDELVKRMLKAKAFIGSADDVIEDEKIKFELNY